MMKFTWMTFKCLGLTGRKKYEKKKGGVIVHLRNKTVNIAKVLTAGSNGAVEWMALNDIELQMKCSH